jgi:uncharacterized membrane protein YraQ (UPF0718 family)
VSGASRYINRAFQARPLIAILLATVVGAFSPFCSCGVIPVIAALLISGVPLAPVMSFWIASPSMDPEAFFLSVSTIGWELAVWRMVATLILSLSAGFVTHFIVQRGWLDQRMLRQRGATSVQSTWALLKRAWSRLKLGLTSSLALRLAAKDPVLVAGVACCSASASLGVSLADSEPPAPATPAPASGCGASCGSTEGDSCSTKPRSFRRRLLDETRDATLMVTKFMALAFFLEALITLYIPSEWIAGLLGHQNPWAIPTAAFLGVPVYTSNLTALPMVSGLLAQGMNPAAALAFLIAGPTTTLPAMAAVWGLTSRRVFALYVSFSLVGAVVLGYLYSLVA